MECCSRTTAMWHNPSLDNRLSKAGWDEHRASTVWAATPVAVPWAAAAAAGAAGLSGTRCRKHLVCTDTGIRVPRLDDRRRRSS